MAGLDKGGSSAAAAAEDYPVPGTDTGGGS